ncbi:MAG: hypothetical protein IPH98_08125 [Saprospiraceae bacterium]|nr:hypothetical protein [Candidatus Defluviibacterium haderslevense]
MLYLYFTYNNVLEKIFLIEAQCAEIKLLEMQGIVGDLIKPISFIRKRYAVEKIKNLFVNVRWVKDFGNFILMVIYFLFSLIPLSFNKNFNLFNLSSEFYMKIYWIPIGFGALIFLLILILISKYFIINVKNEITVNWGLANHDLLNE